MEIDEIFDEIEIEQCRTFLNVLSMTDKCVKLNNELMKCQGINDWGLYVRAQDLECELFKTDVELQYLKVSY